MGSYSGFSGVSWLVKMEEGTIFGGLFFPPLLHFTDCGADALPTSSPLAHTLREVPSPLFEL